MIRLTYKHYILFIIVMLAFLSHYTNINNLRKYLVYKERNSRIIIAFGDSLTEGLHSWPKFRRFHPYTIKLQEIINSHIKKSRSKLKVEVKNSGISGEKLTKTMKKRLQKTLKEQRADLVIILAGTNDLVDLANQSANYSHADSISNDLQALHLICYFKGVATAALTIPETLFDVRENNGSMSRARRWVNREISQFVRLNEKKINSTLIDTSSKIPRGNNSNLWDDGLHLTPRGYDKMGEIVFDGIKKIVSQWIVIYDKYS